MSYFIANEHDELNAFYEKKGELLTKILRPIGVAPTAP